MGHALEILSSERPAIVNYMEMLYVFDRLLTLFLKLMDREKR